MLHPLVSLWRHNCRATFYEGGALPADAFRSQTPGASIPIPSGLRRRFGSFEEALHYVRFWLGDRSAQSELRWMLSRTTGSGSSAQRPLADWMNALARGLATGTLVVVEESSRLAGPSQIFAPKKSKTSALSKLPTLASMPTVPKLAALLPSLQAVQIEGAEVMPEIEQTLAQTRASIAAVQGASASLTPAPANIADIQGAMNAASARTSAQMASA